MTGGGQKDGNAASAAAIMATLEEGDSDDNAVAEAVAEKAAAVAAAQAAKVKKVEKETPAEEKAAPTEPAAQEAAGEAAAQEAEPTAEEAGEQARSDPPSAGERLAAALKECADTRLISAVPVFLRALPEDALDRCLICLREALTEELEGGVLDGEEPHLALWREAWDEALEGKQAAAAAAGAKRPFRAMSVPFATSAPAAKRPREEEEEEEYKPPPLTNKLYVANLPYQRTEDDIRAWFQNYVAPVGGLVDEVRFLLDGKGDPKGAAILTFDTIDAARKALELNGEPGLEFRILIVKPDGFVHKGSKGEGKGEKGKRRKGEGKGGKGDAKGKGSKGDSKGGRARWGDGCGDSAKADAPPGDGKSVVLKNLAFTATESIIGAFFAGCGETTAVRIAKDSRTGKARGFAVVEFASTEAAAKAVLRSGQSLKCREVKIELVGGPAPQEVGAEDAAPADGDACAPDAAAPAADAAGDQQSSEAGKQPSADAAAVKAVEPIKFVKANAAAEASEPGTLAAPVSVVPAAEVKMDVGGADAIRKHAQMMVAKAQGEAMVQPLKRSRGEKSTAGGETAEAFLGGEEGLKAVAELLTSHASALKLGSAMGAESLKGQLSALGMKSGGSPLERAQRLFRLQGISTLDQIPNDLLASAKKQRGEVINIRKEPIQFVKSSTGYKAEAP